MTDDATVSPVFEQRALSTRAIRTPKTAELVALKLRRMIVDGELKDGDHLPHEAELMEHFAVSRPTLREAVRVLEAERLVEVRRGSRSGARVCVPGPEVVARPASLLLELSGATVADVFVAREAIEPAAARILAESGTEDDFDELERLLDEEVPEADLLEQRAPLDPDAMVDTPAAVPFDASADLVDEADRLEQQAVVPDEGEDDYPRA